MRNLDFGDETIDDHGILVGLRPVIRKIHFAALVTAIFLTALTFLLR